MDFVGALEKVFQMSLQFWALITIRHNTATSIRQRNQTPKSHIT